MKIISITTMNFMIRLLKANKLLVKNWCFLLTLSFIFLITSCSKPPGKIGAVIQPEQSKLDVFYSDTSTVTAYSLPDDSIRTDEKSLMLLGSLMDPVFGGSVAGIYSQFKLSANAPDFGDDPILDSLVLHLLYTDDTYGDENTPLVVHAYEMLEGIEFLDEYYSNTVIPVASTDYGNFQFVPRPNDSIIIVEPIINPPPYDTIEPGIDTLAPALRIRLSDASTALGYKFLNADTSEMKDSDAFVEFFKGLYLVTEPVTEGGSISFLDIISSSSVMILYYHNVIDDTVYPSNFSFIVNQYTPHFNKYEHDFLSGDNEFKAQVINKDASLGVQKFYTQGIAGVKSIVKFPHIRDWAAVGNIAINEAKLVFPGYESTPYNGAPRELGLVEIMEDGTYSTLIDEQEGSAYFDGNYESSSNDFTFRITRHIQSLISDTSKVDYGLYMFVRGESNNPERFIFNGNQPLSDTALPFRLEIVYTELK